MPIQWVDFHRTYKTFIDSNVSKELRWVKITEGIHMAVATPLRPKTIAVKDAAERLGVHENTVRNWADRGVLDSFKTPTGRRKIVLSGVERLEREMYGAPVSPVELGATTTAPPQAGELERIQTP